MIDNEEKIAKLKVATDEAEQHLNEARTILESTKMALKKAKEKYRDLPQNEQETLQVNDTELPELLEQHAQAKDDVETAQKRYDTNTRYLSMMEAKLNTSDT